MARHMMCLLQSLKKISIFLYSDNTGRTLGSGAPLTLDPYGHFMDTK